MQGKMGIRQPLIVALCGDSGSGKTTLTDGMVRVFGQERILHICLDDYHLLDRATRLRTGVSALRPEANNLPLMTEHLQRLARGESIVIRPAHSPSLKRSVLLKLSLFMACIPCLLLNCVAWLTCGFISIQRTRFSSNGRLFAIAPRVAIRLTRCAGRSRSAGAIAIFTFSLKSVLPI